MYYDLHPQYDSRHARALIKDATKLIRDFVQAHGMGRDHPDQIYKRDANELRSQLAARQLEISESCRKFTVQADRESLTAQIGKIQLELDSHPAFEFPTVVEIDPTIANSFLNRNGGNENQPSLQFPIVVHPPAFNRFNVPGVPTTTAGSVRPRLPIHGPSLPPSMNTLRAPFSTPALPAPMVRHALPAPIVPTVAPAAPRPPHQEQALIAFSNSSRAPSRNRDAAAFVP